MLWRACHYLIYSQTTWSRMIILVREFLTMKLWARRKGSGSYKSKETGESFLLKSYSQKLTQSRYLLCTVLSFQPARLDWPVPSAQVCLCWGWRRSEEMCTTGHVSWWEGLWHMVPSALCLLVCISNTLSTVCIIAICNIGMIGNRRALLLLYTFTHTLWEH